MKCPRCGSEMQIDTHRKYSIPMCYECGYMEGRNMGENPIHNRVVTNYERLNGMNFNEAVAFMADGLGLDENTISAWFEKYVA